MIDVTPSMLGLTVRPLGRRDVDRVAAAVRTVSRRTLLARFGSVPKDGPDLSWILELDGLTRVAYGASETATGAPVGLARYAELPDAPGHVEMAMMIVDRWQGLGAGTVLARELRGHAERARMCELRAIVADDNRAARRIMQGLGASVVGAAYGGALDLRVALR